MRRRSLLGAGVMGRAVLALGGDAALWWHEPVWRDGRLLPAGRTIMVGVARANARRQSAGVARLACDSDRCSPAAARPSGRRDAGDGAPRDGWRVFGGRRAAAPSTLDCDVAVVGSGAGAGITAELQSRAGIAVVIVEEGSLKSSSDFNQLDSEAYPALYQQSAARKTADKAINILQGRCVGGRWSLAHND